MLALPNLLHDRRRFIATVLGVAFAVFLIVVQGSLMFGFISAASKMIRVGGGDIGISAPGVPCFDFAGRIPRQYGDRVMAIRGVERVAAVIAAFTTFEKPNGARQAVLLVDADARVTQAFPSAAQHG